MAYHWSSISLKHHLQTKHAGAYSKATKSQGSSKSAQQSLDVMFVKLTPVQLNRIFNEFRSLVHDDLTISSNILSK